MSNRVVVCATGESIKHITKIKEDIKLCSAYIFNKNILPILDAYPDIFDNLHLRYIANRMIPSIIPKQYFIRYNIREVHFTVPESRKYEITKSIEKLHSYNLPYLKYHFVPNILVQPYAQWNNITFYAMLKAIYSDNSKDVLIIGLDFWEGDYINKKTTEKQKTLPRVNDLYNKFKQIITLHPFVNFTLYTLSDKIKSHNNLKVVKVEK